MFSCQLTLLAALASSFVDGPHNEDTRSNQDTEEVKGVQVEATEET